MSPTQLHSDPSQQAAAQLWVDPFLGSLAQVGNPGVPARSNAQYLGIAAHTDGAVATTGVAFAVPIPVVPGDYITNVNIPIGATAGSTLTHQFAALYSGIAVPARLAQSTDSAVATITASAVATYALTSPVLITPTNAPNGFVYASFSATGTMPTAVGVTLVATGAAYQWFSGSPLFYAMTHGSAVGGTAPTTIASPSAKAFCPYVILS